jgi:sialate O-acetylesterase
MFRLRMLCLPLMLVLLAACQTTNQTSAAPAADIKLAALFSDHMVLQRGQKIPVWGSARPGGEVTVQLEGRTARAMAGEDGKWMVKLPAMKAGGPYELLVSGEAADPIRLTDVLVGEVWLASGQSNMEMPVKVGDYGVLNGAQEIAAANYPRLRLFTVTKATSFTPLTEVKTDGWKPCTPESIPSFSAVGYFFGRKVHQELGVPVGIIHSSWGGTLAEAWTSKDGLLTHPDFKPTMEKFDESVSQIADVQKQYDEQMAAWQLALLQHDAGHVSGQPAWQAPDTPTTDWQDLDQPALWDDKGGLGQLDGAVWFRRQVEVPAGWEGQALELSLGPINDKDITWFNGTEVGRTEGANTGKNPRLYPVPAALVKSGPIEVVVRVYDLNNKGGFVGNASDLALRKPGTTESVSLAGPWKYKIGLDLKNAPPQPTAPAFSAENPNNPTVLYNAMIAPLVPYGIRGAIWYQGESNAGQAFQYRTLFPTMIKDWRGKWGADFDFHFVQLANFQDRKTEPSDDAWAELREAQAMTLQLPNTGMAVIIDIGEAKDIHPKNKQDVGRRLALSALAKTYGKNIVYSGPMYKSMETRGNSIVLHFDNIGSGLDLKGDPAQSFEIAGPDKKFVWADAKIEGNTIVVSSPSVAQPQAVRYAWQANPNAPLYNADGLPASPFRTDDWPGMTQPK